MAIGGRTGALPCFVASALSLANLAWAWFALPESLPLELRSKRPRSLVPLDLASARVTLARQGIRLAVLANFALTISFAGLTQTFRYYSKDEFAMSAFETGAVLTFVGVVSAGMQGAMRVLSRRFDDKTLMLAGTVLECAAFGGFAASPSIGRAAFFAASGLLAVGHGLVQPSLPSYVSKRADPHSQGETLGTTQSFAALANVLGPALGGWLYQALGSRAPYVTGTVGMAAAVAMVSSLPRDTPTYVELARSR
jgi:MFS family permease